MANPIGKDLYSDEFLTNFAVDYARANNQFIADQMFPTFNVDQQTGKYDVYTRQDWMRLHARLRTAGAESAGGQYSTSTGTYSVDVWAFHKDVDAQDIANQGRRFNLEKDAVRFVTLQLQLAREWIFAQSFFKTSVWTGGTTGADLVGGVDFTAWDDPAMDIINDIEKQVEAMRLATGMSPNILLIGRPGWRAMRQNPVFLEAIKYTQRGVVTTELASELLGVKVIVADATYDASVDGSATPSPQWFYGKNALLVHAAGAPGDGIPSAGYIFTWNRYSDYGINIYSFDHAPTKSRRFEGEFTAGPKIVAPDLGVFFSGIVS